MRKSNYRSATSIIAFVAAILIYGCTKNQFDTFLRDSLAPEVTSVNPSHNMTSVALNAKAIINFNEKIDVTTLNQQTFFLKKGESLVSGTVSCSDSVATFTPAQNLEAGTLYTATLTSSVKDISGNPILQNYTWSFTTAAQVDVIAPVILSTSPAANATGIAAGIIPSVEFSEPLNPASVTATSFLLKQGVNAVAGTVTLTSNIARFTPSSPLSAGAVYTATITTGIKDLAGNMLASSRTWSFTVAAPVTGKSFANDVVPILNLCNACHKHGWTPSSNASTFYANLLNAGYISTTSPTSGKIYKQVSGGHPSGSSITTTQKNTVLTWINEGSKNN